MKADPPIREDGRCACGCGKKRGAIAVKHSDPFATSPCCKTWHGLDFGLHEDERDSDLHKVRQSEALSEALQRLHYTGELQAPVGAVMVESRQRDLEARARLGLAA